MTENEVLVMVKGMQIAKEGDMAKTFEVKRVLIKALEDVQLYRAVGTVEEFKALKEKSSPKEVVVCGDGYYDGHLVYDEYSCPNCGKIYELEYEEYDYCPNCGQHITIAWSE